MKLVIASSETQAKTQWGTRFTDSDASNVIPGDGRCQEVPLQLVAAETGQSRGRAIRLNADAHRDAAGPDVAAGLQEGHLVLVVEAEAAVFDRLVDAEKSGVAKLLEEFVRGKDLILLPLTKEIEAC